MKEGWGVQGGVMLGLPYTVNSAWCTVYIHSTDSIRPTRIKTEEVIKYVENLK